MPDRKHFRIAVLGNALSPHIQTRAKGLADLGHEIVLFSADHAEVPGVAVRKICPALTLPLCGWTILFSYIEAIRELDPDVIHVHYAMGFHSWATLFLPEYPTVISLMGKDILFKEQGNPSWGARRLTLEAIKQANHLTSKSEHINRALELYLPGSLQKTEIIRWGIDPTLFRPVKTSGLRKQHDLDAEDVILLCPRGIAPIYNTDILLKAFARICHENPHARLLLFDFIQEPDYRQQMEALIDDLGIRNHIRFIGSVPLEEMPGYYGIADIVLSIPSSDGMPQSLFEALACEKPMILSDLPMYREIVTHNREVLMVDHKPEAVAEAGLKLIREPSLRQSMGKMGRQTIIDVASFPKEADRAEAILQGAADSYTQKRTNNPAKAIVLLILHYVEAILAGRER